MKHASTMPTPVALVIFACLCGCSLPPMPPDLIPSLGEFQETSGVSGPLIYAGKYRNRKVLKGTQVTEIVTEHRYSLGRRGEVHFPLPEGAIEVGFKRRAFGVAITYLTLEGARMLERWFVDPYTGCAHIETEYRLGPAGKWEQLYQRGAFSRSKKFINAVPCEAQ